MNEVWLYATVEAEAAMGGGHGSGVQDRKYDLGARSGPSQESAEGAPSR